ncbi:MAG TPA: hypothetical protein VLB68_04665 [Pyrinomonadaceae bacterium]|nr:hypothetical protein [Pyrinomonadaceae bacterium]
MKDKTMNGLRVYTEVKGFPDPYCVYPTFYSRRADGPYYRWRYEIESKRWLFSRIGSHDFASAALVQAPWYGVPDALKSSLSEHYLE